MPRRHSFSAASVARPPRLHWWTVAALCCALVLLEACGFRLRGSLGEFESIPATYVQGGDPAAYELKQFLRTGGAEVVEERALARLIVTVERVQRDRRVLSWARAAGCRNTSCSTVSATMPRIARDSA